MQKLLLIIAGVMMLSVPCALAQDDDEGLKVGDPAADLEAAEWLNAKSRLDVPSIKELQGMVVVLFFWVSWHEGGEAFLPLVNVYENQFRSQGVYAIGITDASLESTQKMVDDAKVFFPVGVESKAAQEYGFRNGFGFVVIDPQGKITFKGTGTDVNGMVQAVGTALNETPPSKTHPIEARTYHRMMEMALGHVRDDEFGPAFKSLQNAVQRTVLGDRLKSRAYEAIDLLDLMGYDELAMVDPLLDADKYDDAARLLREIIRKYRGLDCYKDAKKLYETLKEDDEDFKTAVSRFSDEDVAARQYRKARETLRAHRYGESHDQLDEIITKYPKTEAAVYARQMLDRMKSNRTFWLHIKDHDAGPVCRKLIADARNHMGKRRLREAERLLRKVMREYPETIWAEEAKELLIEMHRTAGR